MVAMEAICQVNRSLVWGFSALLILPDTLEVSFVFTLDSSAQGKQGWAATALGKAGEHLLHFGKKRGNR